MKTSSHKTPTLPLTKAPRAGGGHKLGPHSPKPLPPDAVWATSLQVRARYGGTSDMWIYRKIKHDPDFPKPSYLGRLMMFSVSELDQYDRKLLSKKTPPPRKAARATS
jgi:predicted DNA-binding transcriptional regulator AlpA